MGDGRAAPSAPFSSSEEQSDEGRMQGTLLKLYPPKNKNGKEKVKFRVLNQALTITYHGVVKKSVTLKCFSAGVWR